MLSNQHEGQRSRGLDLGTKLTCLTSSTLLMAQTYMAQTYRAPDRTCITNIYATLDEQSDRINKPWLLMV